MPDPATSPQQTARPPHIAGTGAASPVGARRRSDGPVYEPVEPYGSGSWAARENLTDILRLQLLGPIGGDNELLPVAPDARYLIGRIAPTRLNDTGDHAGEPPTSEATELAASTDPYADSDADPDAAYASAPYLGDDLDARASTGVPVSGVDESSPDGDRDDEPVRRGLMIPASMGLRFQVPADLEAVTVHASWGVYNPEKTGHVSESGREERHFRRTDVSIPVRVPLGQSDDTTTDYPLQDQVTLRVDTHLDTTTSTPRRLVEIALCNDRETPRRIPVDAWLFQTRLDVTPAGAAEGQAVFLPVHDATEDPHLPGDPEEARLELQYRDKLEFAVGRTCSADWTVADGERRATHVSTEWIPTAETPQTRAADVPGAMLDMETLAAATPAELEAGLRPIVTDYTGWLDEQQERIPDLPAHLHDTAAEVVDEAQQVRDQLADGVDFLLADAEARRCFAFMNRVMADQRVHSQIAAARQADPALTPARAEQQVRAGDVPHHWRVFQLAFVLMQIRALTEPATARRSRAGRAKVELLFFPTGGGKTEAYLGLAAYAFAIRRRQGRIEGPDGVLDGSAGVTVLMRYTLRLLTSQQFQRATTLVCAAELARREDPATWGEEPFRIGLWVGTAVSPKRVEEAAKELTRLRSQHAGYRFSALQLGHCPWCGLALGHNNVEVDEARGRVFVHCPDEFGECPFSEGGQVGEGIPVLTTDEEIYRLVPAFVIATVDKFARLAREGQAASLFGHVARYCDRHGYVPTLDGTGASDYPGCSAKESHPAKNGLPAARVRPATRLRPPDLIIQDELHLITGALGTTVGLFEVAVDALTTWRMFGPDGAPREVKPLIVASSATVRRAADQVCALYGRGTTVFPPQVIDAADTFFSKETPPSRKHPGRRYVGLSTTGVRLTNAEIQVAQILMAGGQLLLDDGGAEADPYMTLVGYFSATRELAGMARYMQDDIQTALAKGIRGSGLPRRRGSAYGSLNLGELTSRIASTDITSTLDEMAVSFDPDVHSTRAREEYRAARAAGKDAPVPRESNPFDAVLATSMLQVGVDVTRLGLMLIVGQPKNTAEYIQASSRVGRDAGRPGLVVTIGNWARPRDLAHYEQFRHFHETFYRRVEPLSVTPFSVTSLERGLDGVLVACARVLQAAVAENGLNPERGAGNAPRQTEVLEKVAHAVVARIEHSAAGDDATRYARNRLQGRIDAWREQAKQTLGAGRSLNYERVKDPAKEAALMMGPEAGADRSTGGDGPVLVVANSMREVQPEINLLVSPDRQRLAWRPPEDAPVWQAQEPHDEPNGEGSGKK